MSPYKPYSQYKDSGVEWLGKIPEHWVLKPFWTLYTRVKRTNYASEELLSVYRDYGVIPKDSRDDNDNKASEDLSTYQLVEINDIAMNKMKAWQGSLGVSIYRGIVSPAYFVFKPMHKENSQYMHHLFRSPQYIAGYLSLSKGIRINQWDLDPQYHSRMLVSLPPFQEQQSIANFLDNATCKIDTLIQKQQNLIELLKEKRQALISHAVTKGLNPHIKMKDSGVEWLGEIPEHWEMKRLKFVSSYKNSNIDKKSYENQKQVRLCNYTDVYYNENITNDIEFMIATASDSEINAMSLKKGDIIITKDSENPADIGIPAIVIEELDNTVCGYHLTVIEANYDMDSFYLYRTIQSSNTKAYLHAETPGITRYGLKQDTIGSILVVCPPYSEQQTIANYLDNATCKIDTLISKSQKAIELLKERRTALISATVTGKIDVRNHLNANYETGENTHD